MRSEPWKLTTLSMIFLANSLPASSHVSNSASLLLGFRSDVTGQRDQMVRSDADVHWLVMYVGERSVRL